jgi:hypothetical protein
MEESIVKYNLDEITKFRVAFICSMLGEEDALFDYINGYICSRRLYIREWPVHFKISTFIT